MSEQVDPGFLAQARTALNSLSTMQKGQKWSGLDLLAAAVEALILHLEAQQETPQALAGGLNMPESHFQNPPSEKPSSQATETAEETKPTLTISFSLGGGRRRIALTESQAATLSPFLPEDTWVSCSLLMDHGLPPVAATGETLTSRASTPPTGSH